MKFLVLRVLLLAPVVLSLMPSSAFGDWLAQGIRVECDVERDEVRVYYEGSYAEVAGLDPGLLVERNAAGDEISRRSELSDCRLSDGEYRIEIMALRAGGRTRGQCGAVASGAVEVTRGNVRFGRLEFDHCMQQEIVAEARLRAGASDYEVVKVSREDWAKH